MESYVVFTGSPFSAKPLAVVRILSKTSLLNQNKNLSIGLEESKQ